MTGLYDLDIDRYIERPLHQLTRSGSGDFLRPNLCRTALFRNSFFNRIVYLWNQLPNDIKLSTSVLILKSKLFSYYSDKLNTVFDIDRPRTWKTSCSKCRVNWHGGSRFLKLKSVRVTNCYSFFPSYQ